MKTRCPALPTVSGYEDACALGHAFARGEADPVAVAEACLARAKAGDAVFISLTEKRALAEAGASKARHAANCALSPFDGVPVGWKDMYHVAGSVTTGGSELYRHNPPEAKDGPLVTLTAGAGMVCIGKLNTSEFAYSGVGYNPHYGTPVNPHSKAGQPLIPGGSSSGSGVAVAAGILPIAMGSDTGGSIRIPAALNGVTGFKPTSGWYSTAGMLNLSRTLDTTGPLARSARDLAVMDRILRGCPCDTPPVTPDIRGRRFVVDEDIVNDARVQQSVRDNFDAAVNRLEKAGAVIIRRRVEPFHEALKLVAQGWLLGPEFLVELDHILNDEAKAALLDPRVRKRAEAARGMPATTLVRAYWGRKSLTEAMRRDLDGDALLSPAVEHVAPPLRDLEEDMDVFFRHVTSTVRLTAPGNVMDMPGVALPTGVDDNGAPTGLLLSMAKGLDAETLRLALAAEEFVTRG